MKKMKFGETKNEKKMKKMKNKWKINENRKMIEKQNEKKMKLQMKTQMKNKWKKNNFKHFQSVARCESYNASFLPAARG